MSNIAIKGATTGTGTFTIESPATNTDRTLTLPDEAGTVLTSASDITQNSGPAFSAYIGSDQSISGSTWTKANFNTELFDTDNCFDTSTNRFTPNVAGYYQVNHLISIGGGGYYSIAYSALYKNGVRQTESTLILQTGIRDTSSYGYSTLIEMNGTTDYLEVYGYTNLSASPNFYDGVDRSMFTAVLARRA